MKILLKYCLTALAVTTLLMSEGQVRPFPKAGVQDQTSFVVGTWTLTRTANPKDQRQLNFNARLEGTYRNSQNKETPIKNVKYKDGYLYFNVPDLHLYFEMRKVGDHFEGRLTVFSATEKKKPEAVVMTKNK